MRQTEKEMECRLVDFEDGKLTREFESRKAAAQWLVERMRENLESCEFEAGKASPNIDCILYLMGYSTFYRFEEGNKQESSNVI